MAVVDSSVGQGIAVEALVCFQLFSVCKKHIPQQSQPCEQAMLRLTVYKMCHRSDRVLCC